MIWPGLWVQSSELRRYVLYFDWLHRILNTSTTIYVQFISFIDISESIRTYRSNISRHNFIKIVDNIQVRQIININRKHTNKQYQYIDIPSHWNYPNNLCTHLIWFNYKILKYLNTNIYNTHNVTEEYIKQIKLFSYMLFYTFQLYLSLSADIVHQDYMHQARVGVLSGFFQNTVMTFGPSRRRGSDTAANITRGVPYFSRNPNRI